ncbi:DUF5011 domain-containing protein, partial [Verrucomicrobia bacterium]|nr:DUF5011 domain-containing protein [Verrucomicrobiota bacterium]
TLTGAASVTHELGTTYTDEGATADGGETVTTTGTVDVNTAGTYTLTYTATDAAGNAATAVTRTVTVSDTTAPVITLSGELNQGGANFMDQEAGVAFVEPGVTATDNVDGLVTVNATGSVDVSAPGTYILTYTAADAAGNEATSVTRTVVVADTISPIITLQGDATMTIAAGDDFTDPGSSANDSFEGELTVSVTGSVDTASLGAYVLRYNVSDSSKNAAEEVKRTVNVVDQAAPIITLSGELNQGGANFMDQEAGVAYEEPGATATDNVDGPVAVITTGSVDVNTPGTYILTYNATDSEGNEATPMTRTVVVVDRTAPLITLGGDASVELVEGTLYTDAGAIATDSFDENVAVTISGQVDESTIGSYTLTYNASDAAGNAAAEVARTVKVVDGVTFIIQDQTLAGDARVTVPVKVSSFAHVGGMQFTLTWDPSVLTFSSLGDFNHSTENTELFFFGETNFNLAQVANGKLPVLYEHVLSLDASVDDNATIFSVTFDVVGGVGSSTDISFGDDPTPRKVASFSTTAPVFTSQNGTIRGEPDTVAPVITLVNEASLEHKAGTNYTDAGANATDNSDSSVTVEVSGEVNVNAPGTYTLTYNAADSEGNQATPVTRTVVVVDLTSPVITLSGPLNQGGENFMDQEAGFAYVEPGATAMDTVDGPVAVITTGTVDISNLGTYILTYNAIDAAGNAATPLMRTVVVKDTIKPVLTLPGGSLTTVLQNTVFDDPGATVNDSFDTGLVALAVSTVDTSTLGSYTVTYSASDNSGNPAQEVTRTVLVVDDTTPPVITLLGAPFSLHEAGTLFTDPGAEGSDNRDGKITSSIQESGNVDVQAIGVYELKYDLADAAGNEALQKIRTVQVNDSIAPEIILDGESSLEHEAGTEYKDKGSIVKDSFENGLIAEVTGSVDSSKLGTYTLTFNASDSSGNPAVAVTRTVSVVDTTPPVIALSGEGTLTLAVGDTFTDPGSSVSDSFEKGLTATVVGDVDTSKSGSYQLTYSAQDSSKNDASKVLLTVHVTDQTAPVITLSGDLNQGGENFMDQEAGVKYVEPGATAEDNVDGKVTVKTTGSVNVSKLGTYILTYNATDAAGNAATPLTRTVVVKDTIKPVLTLEGESKITHIIGTSYSDSGAKLFDSFETDLTAELTGDVNTEELGAYTLSYSAKDSSGNEATPVERTVTVTDGLEVTQITSTSNQISENGGENKITVYLSQPALAERTIISAVATPASRVKVPASFPVVRDLEKIEFTVTGIDDSDSNGDELVSIQLKTAYRDLGEPIEMTIQDDD